MAAFDTEWTFEDDQAYQLACQQPENRERLADEEDAYWARMQEGFEEEGEETGFEDDGQPDEYTEWQDFMGGDDWDHGQYDSYDGE